MARVRGNLGQWEEVGRCLWVRGEGRKAGEGKEGERRGKLECDLVEGWN